MKTRGVARADARRPSAPRFRSAEESSERGASRPGACRILVGSFSRHPGTYPLPGSLRPLRCVDGDPRRVVWPLSADFGLVDMPQKPQTWRNAKMAFEHRVAGLITLTGCRA